MSRHVQRSVFTLAALLLFAAASTTARADTYAVTGTTQFSFTCFQATPCSTTANSVTFGTGADTTTFTFTGATLNASIGETATTLTLGSITTTITGAGFTSPASIGGLPSPLGSLSFTLTHTSPAPATQTIAPFLAGGPGSYRLRFGGNLGTGGTIFYMPTGGPHHPAIVYEFNFDAPGGG